MLFYRAGCLDLVKEAAFEQGLFFRRIEEPQGLNDFAFMILLSWSKIRQAEPIGVAARSGGLNDPIFDHVLFDRGESFSVRDAFLTEPRVNGGLRNRMHFCILFGCDLKDADHATEAMGKFFLGEHGFYSTGLLGELPLPTFNILEKM
jgi:hypothetical protein